MSEQWIDLDTADPAMLALIQGTVQGERHGEMEMVKETREAWFLHCPTCGCTVRHGKRSGFETLSRGKIRREGEHWLWGLHSWFADPDLRMGEVSVDTPS